MKSGDYNIILYHVTSYSNLMSISQHGIQPKFSTGVYQRSWFVQKQLLEWSIIHTSSRHKTPTNELIVFVLDIPRFQVIRFATKHVFYAISPLMPETWFEAHRWEYGLHHEIGEDEK